MNHVLLTNILCLGWINARRERGWPHRADTGEWEGREGWDQAVWLLILVSSEWWLVAPSLSSGPPLAQITPAKLSPAPALQPAWAGTDSTQWMFTNHRDNGTRSVTPWHEPSWPPTSGCCSPWGPPSPSSRSRTSSLCSPGQPHWPADTSWASSSVIWPELVTRIQMKRPELTSVKNRWRPHHQDPSLANNDLMRTLRGVGWSETPDKECKIRDKST